MAIYHFSVSPISRGKGQNAVASASYRSGEILHNRMDGTDKFYPREVKPESFILAPSHAPSWVYNREELWNNVEDNERNKNAQLAREVRVALPVELSREDQKELVENFVKENFTNHGMIADCAIHRDKDENPHCHIMLTMREIDRQGNWKAKKKKEYILDENGEKIYNKENRTYKFKTVNMNNWDSKETLKKWRGNWAIDVNFKLRELGIPVEITDKSYKDLGVDLEPTKHEFRKGINKVDPDIVEYNNSVKKYNQIKMLQDKNEEQIEMIEKSIYVSKQFTGQELGEMKELTPILKMYITPANLQEKREMLNRWRRSDLIKNVIPLEESLADNNLQTIEKSMEKAESILDKHADKFMDKYYPNVAQNENISSYVKLQITDDTLLNKKTFNTEKVYELINKYEALEIDYQLSKITNEPYANAKRLMAQSERTSRYIGKESEKLGADIFKKENRFLIEKLPKEEQEKVKKAIVKVELCNKMISVVDQTYSNNINKYYPELNVSALTLNQKEMLFTATNYYQKSFTEEEIKEIMHTNKVPPKFGNEERRELLNKIQKNLPMTKEERKFLSVSGNKYMFMNECIEHEETLSKGQRKYVKSELEDSKMKQEQRKVNQIDRENKTIDREDNEKYFDTKDQKVFTPASGMVKALFNNLEQNLVDMRVREQSKQAEHRRLMNKKTREKSNKEQSKER